MPAASLKDDRGEEPEGASYSMTHERVLQNQSQHALCCRFSVAGNVVNANCFKARAGNVLWGGIGSKPTGVVKNED